MESIGNSVEKPIRAQSMVIVLAKKESSIRATVTFLRRRDIAAKFVSSLSDAIDAFANNEGNILLLSVNFPHPKVESLPVLMNQSFGIETIVFAEDSDRKSSGRLSSARTKHILFGSVSGTVVMMKVRQIEREMNDRDAIAAALSNSTKLESDKQEAREALKRALSESERSESIIQKGQRSKMNSELQASAESEPISFRAQEFRAALDNGLTAPAINRARKRRLIILTEIKTKRRVSNETDEQALSEPDILPTSEIAEGPLLEADRRAKERALAEAVARAPLMAEAGASSSAPTMNESTLAPGATALSEPKSTVLSEQEIIVECLRECLTIVAGATNPLVNSLQAYTSAALVSLKTSKLSCAFVISVAHSVQSSSELFFRIEAAFFALMRDHGIEFEDRDTHSIGIDNLRIVKSAFETSEFTAVVSQKDIEIGVAKVLVGNPVPEFLAHEENMLTVNLSDLPIDEPVTFSVFLHLKNNQKYIRYLKRGSVMTQLQATRLEKTHPRVMLDQEEIDAYRRHYAAHAIQAPKRKSI